MLHLLSFALALPALAVFALHLLLALAVAADTARLEATRPTELVGPVTWTFGVFVVGAPAALVYWLMHRSRLQRQRSPGS